MSTLMFLPAGVPHAEEHHRSVRCLLLELDPAQCGIGDGDQLPEPMSIESCEIHQLMRKLHFEFSNADAWTKLVIQSLASEVVALTARDCQLRKLTRTPDWLKRIKQRLHDEFLDTPTLSQIASDAGKHSSHVARAFRAHYGISPGQYVRQLRVEFAKQQLADETITLVEVAANCGFSDQSHFSRAFRKITGMTPSRYRKQVSSR
ncbi:MAG: helix-turn-helix domain-containing protein [Pirellulaceae bacterium]